MPLPTTKVAAAIKSPRLFTLYGTSKVGKTTMLAKLDKCLIIDTEKGTDYIDAYKVNVNNLQEFINVVKELRSTKHDFKYVALDTLDNLALWYEQSVCRENKVQTIGDMPYGAGYSIVREKVMQAIQALKPVAPHLILVGHLKKTLIGTETSVEVNTSSLDLTGKLKNLVMADSDAIGIVYRGEENTLMISFQGSDQAEVGSRCEHLKGKIMPFEWENIYI